MKCYYATKHQIRYYEDKYGNVYRYQTRSDALFVKYKVFHGDRVIFQIWGSKD